LDFTPNGFWVCEHCRANEAIVLHLPLAGIVMILIVLAWQQFRERAFLRALDDRDRTIRQVVTLFLQHIGTDDK
jgi:hypothetical protein